MKLLFSHKTMLALVVAAATAIGHAAQADEPAPPSENQVTLPPGIAPDSQLAQVFKLVQAGLDAGVIKTFVENSTGAFELDADKIIVLKDEGVPSDIINIMLDHDKKFYASTATAPPAPPASPAPGPDTAPPATQVTVTYFNDTLTPYGSWVEVDGYGRCWRPTVVNYDTSWRPYCDRGHWVYTDCGWYWDSEYSWGSTFHYGRWFRHSRFGWCWYPDTEWAPSWVTFRSNNDYCGWAPLPPLAVYRPGAGFFYRGASVSVGFDFGLDAGCFTFVAPNRFCERRPRYYCAEPARVNRFFHETTVVNNYNIHNTTIVNNGIPVQRIRTETHRPIQPVNVAALPNAARQGWRGGDDNRAAHGDNRGSTGGNDRNNNAAGNFSNGSGQPGPGQNRGGDQRNSANGASTTHSTSPPATVDHNANSDRNGQRDRENSSRKPQTQSKPVIGAPVDNQSVPSAAADRNADNERNSPRERDNTVRRLPPQSKPVIGAPADNQTVYQRNNAVGSVQGQQPQAVKPAANNVAPDRIPQPNAGERVQTENNSRSAREQARQFNTPSAPVNSAPQNDWRQNRGTESPVVSAPVNHSAPQAEPRQSVQQREQQRVQPPTAIVPPHRYTAPPAPAPAPAASQSRSSDRGSERGHNSDKDK